MVLHKPRVINLLFSNRGADFVYSIPDDTQPSGRRNLGRFNKTATLDKISIAYFVNALGGVGVYNYTTPRNILYNLINNDNVRGLPINMAVFDMGEINLNTDSEKIILQESPWQREMNQTERRMTREVGLSGPGRPGNPSSLANPTIMLPRNVIHNITGYTTPKGTHYKGYGGKYKRKTYRRRTIMRKGKSKRRRTMKRK
jgi:hypothetical protein